MGGLGHPNARPTTPSDFMWDPASAGLRGTWDPGFDGEVGSAFRRIVQWDAESEGRCREGCQSPVLAPVWVIVSTWPATVSVVDRVPCLFTATRYRREALPVPDVVEAIVTHEAPLVAVHVHPSGCGWLTARRPNPPSGPNDALVGEMLADEHEEAPPGGGGEGGGPFPPAWSIVIACPAAVTVPDRLPPALAATVSWIVPVPLPLAPLATTIHDAALEAVHAQPDWA